MDIDPNTLERFAEQNTPFKARMPSNTSRQFNCLYLCRVTIRPALRDSGIYKVVDICVGGEGRHTVGK